MTTAAPLIANAKALLLDFDGPVTTLMPPTLNAQAADQARTALDGVELPDEIAATTDHLAILRFAAERVPGRLLIVERSCTEAEVACAQQSDPSPEIRGLLADAGRRSLAVAIVSNNSCEAVRAFLNRFDWTKGLKTLACRTPGRVGQMKPSPYLVVEAARLLGVRGRDCVLVGDSITDVEAGHAAGIKVIGLGKTVARAEALRAAGADATLLRQGASD